MATTGLQESPLNGLKLRAPWGCWGSRFVPFPGLRAGFEVDWPPVECWRHAVIVAHAGKALGIWQRRWGYQASYWESWFDQQFRWRRGDFAWLHYTLPRTSPGFIALRYLVSADQTRLKTVESALCGLDEVARLLGSYAIVCSSSNGRLKDGIMGRYGFERHAIRVPGHHFIKRLREWKDPNGDIQPPERASRPETRTPVLIQ